MEMEADMATGVVTVIEEVIVVLAAVVTMGGCDSDRGSDSGARSSNDNRGGDSD